MGAIQPAADLASLTDSKLQPLLHKLQTVYGYKDEDFHQASNILTPIPRRSGPWSLAVLDKNHAPLMLIDSQSEKPEDARKSAISFSPALPPTVRHIIWTNGNQHLFMLRSPNERWHDIPDIPARGQSPKEIGRLLRRHLVVPHTLLPEFLAIRNHLAANAIGVTRDEVIAREVLKLLFCKIYDERHTRPDHFTRFCAGIEEPSHRIKQRIESELLRAVVRSRNIQYPHEIDGAGRLRLDADSVAYTVGLLQHYEITNARRDVIGQAFESLIGPALRGNEGQFFTPKNLVNAVVAMIDPRPGERILDPACGSGGFLVAAAEWLQTVHSSRQTTNEIYGVEKDGFLATLAQAYMGLIGERAARVFCADALKPPSSWKSELLSGCSLGTFDIVITNPPFGAKIPVSGTQTLTQYQLARIWSRQKDGKLHISDKLAPFRPPQILFIERCLDFLREGGRLAIVLPEGILGNANEAYVRQFIQERAELVAIIDSPLETFLPSTPTKTNVLFLRKKADGTTSPHPVFMAIADKCGHDRRGKPLITADGTPDDDFPKIAPAFQEWKRSHNVNL